jgi:tetratricopeptide (TPR) repeat protein
MRRINVRFLGIVAIVIALIATGAFLLHRAQIDRQAGFLLDRAVRAEEGGDTDEAASQLQRYLGLRPGDADATIQYARLLADRAERPEEQIRAFFALERALRLDPGRNDLRRQAAELAMEPGLGRFSDARVHLEALLDGDAAGDADLLAMLGRALEGDGEDREAEQAYREALEVDPHRVEAYVRLASLLREQLIDEESADRVMGKHNPDSARAYLERGLYRLKYGIEEAEADFARALELAPDDSDVLVASAESALARGEGDQARRLLERARDQAAKDARVYQGLARIESAAGNAEDAVAVLRSGLGAIGDDDAEGRLQLLWSLADAEIDAGRFDEARQIIAELKEINLRPGLQDFLEGKVRAGEGRWRDAVAALRNARTLLTNQPELTYQIDLLLGTCYERLGNPDQRLAAYRRAVAVDPVAIPGRLGLAAAQVALGRIDEAISAYRPLVEQLPGLKFEMARLLLARELGKPESERNWGEVDRVLAAAEAEQPGSAELARLRVQSLLARRQVDDARAELATAVRQHPEDAGLRASLASLIGRGGDREAALAELEELERRQGDTATTRLARASYWASQGGDEAQSALEELKEGLDAFEADDRRRVLNGLILARRQLGDLSGAERLLGELSKIAPEDLAPRIFGIELTLAEGTDEATAEAAAEIDAILSAESPPEDLPALSRLFDLALAADSESLAVRILALLRPAEGDEGPVWRQAEARLLYLQAARLGQGDERRSLLARARTLLNEAASRRPGWAPVTLTLALVEQLDGNADAAIDALEEAREFGVRDRDSLLRLYRLYLGDGRTERADSLVAEMQSLGLGDDDGLIAKLAAESSLREADPARALEEARAAVDPDSGDYRDHLWLAQFLTAADRAEEAEAELVEAVELARDETAPRIALVRFLAANDRRDEALGAIEEARAELPDDRSALALARCFATIGELDRAFPHFDRAIARSPRDPAPLRAAAETALLGNETGRAEDYLTQLARLGTEADAADDATWARRTLALVMAASGDPTKRRAAVEQADAGAAAAVEDLRTRAQVLALQVDQASRSQAIRILEQIIDQKAAGTPDDRFLLAQLYEAAGQWSRARQRMLGLLAENGDNPVYLVRFIGWLLVPEPGRGHDPDPQAARPWIDRLAKLAPDAIQTAEARARSLAALGRADEAVVGLERFAESHPDQLAAVAALVEQLDSPSRAEPLYRLLVERSDDPSDLLRLAGVLERQGDGRLAEAEDAFRRLVAESEDPKAVFRLAGFLARQGRLDEALAICEQARSTCPPSLVANATLELVFPNAPNSDQFERAGRLLEDLRASHPQEVEILFQLANLRSLQGRNDEAERLFRDSVKRAPGQPGPLNNLAWYLALAGDRSKAAEALQLIDRAITDVGPDPNLLDTRSLALLRLDRVDEALDDLQSAISRSRRQDPLWFFHQAQALLQADRRAEAVEALDNARKAGLEESSIAPLERSGYDRLVAALGKGR